MASIIIFGGAGAIGSAIARRLAARGDRPHLAGRDRDKLDAVARETGAGVSVCDVTDGAAVAAAVAEAAGSDGLAGLVYAVGTINLKPLGSLTEADFERDWRVNALGAALALKAATPHLKVVDGASVVLFSTVAVRQGFAAHASVSMAKGAVEGLTLALAAELAPKVRVNCIAPSLTRTPLAEGLTRNEALAKGVAEAHALRRLGEADDSAGLAAFLLGPEAGWITGQVMGVDGGRSTLRTKG
ncbi:SDR family NAD(P)-dependent oxidoreductase [Lichenibacterium ramalinae]|uniref:SDR family oxidoreductase n=1 Tax=Lichenibacterium ramalinae TaxID=2316527 RepID=A0A4Q2RFP4_9HYPH|nr:SDR family oxidoreductase [Lichenibacterium ramalinae]RYB06987.1 SDR family oxidoreductase [Lichenibacterium ramalinae]